MNDEVITHDEVLRWLPPRIQFEWAELERRRVRMLPPEERGWWTEDEITDLPGNWIGIAELSSPEVRYIKGRE